MSTSKAVVALVVLAAVAILFLVSTKIRHVPSALPKSGSGATAPESPSVPRAAHPPLPKPAGPETAPPAPVARNPRIRQQIGRLEASATVRTIVGLDAAARDAKSRQAAMRKLTRNLSAADVRALRMFLDCRAAEEKDIDPVTFDSIKNDALDIMIKQAELPEGLGGDVVRMFRDGAQDDTWRDYCIQYFANYYNARWPATKGGTAPAPVAATEDPERKGIEAAYWEATDLRSGTFAGTALLALERLSRDRPEFDRRKVGDKVVEVAADDSAHPSSRLTCLRICGAMGRAEALPAARALAQTGSTGPLRTAAAATIGDLGDKGDVELLQSLAASTDARMAFVAGSALKLLNDRLAKLEQAAK